MRAFVVGFVAAVIMVITASSSFAQVKDKQYSDWTVYTTTLQGKRTCYAATFPKSKTGNYTRRDEPYFLVTRISKNVFEVSASSGYPYKMGSDVKVSIDKNKFNMFTKAELAWAYDESMDTKIVKAMKKGMTMNIRGTSRKGTYSIDKYSLRGVTAAIDRMNKLCK